MVKKIVIGLLVLIVIAGGALYYVYSNAGGIIKSAIETYGSEATQTSVRVSSVKLALDTGKGGLSGLKVGNPSGFSSGDALELGDIDIEVDPQSVLGTGPIVIKEINVNAPKIAYEHSMSGSNLDTLRNNVKAYANKLSGGGQSSSTGSASGGKEGRKIIIDNFYVRDGKVSVSDAMLKGGAVNADLPTIHLSNIGRAKGGATQAEVTQQILSVITGTAIQVGAGALTKELGTLPGAVGTVVPGGEGVTKSVKGLFGN